VTATLLAAALVACTSGDVSLGRDPPAGNDGATATTVLLGDPIIEATTDSDPAGQAEAFPFVATASGVAASLAIYLDLSTTADPIALGLYSDSSGAALAPDSHPDTLLASGSLARPTGGAWNQAAIAPTPVTTGVRYWIAILGTAGLVQFRDITGLAGLGSETSSAANLSSLPQAWPSGMRWSTTSASLYAPASNTSGP
jgi:hypothetical protein